jgi:glycerol uptake facilitator-like aquaporin
MDMSRRVGAEFFGTFWLVFSGCGAAVLAASFPADRLPSCPPGSARPAADETLVSYYLSVRALEFVSTQASPLPSASQC